MRGQNNSDFFITSNMMEDLESKIEHIKKYKNVMIDKNLTNIYPTDTDLEDEILGLFDEETRKKYENINQLWIKKIYDNVIDRYKLAIIALNNIKLIIKRISNIDKIFFLPKGGIMGDTLCKEQWYNDEKVLKYILKVYCDFYDCAKIIETQKSVISTIDQIHENIINIDESCSLIMEQITNLKNDIIDIKTEFDTYLVYERLVDHDGIIEKTEQYIKSVYSSEKECIEDTITLKKNSLEYYYILFIGKSKKVKRYIPPIVTRQIVAPDYGDIVVPLGYWYGRFRDGFYIFADLSEE